jgi:hypothetical protein
LQRGFALLSSAVSVGVFPATRLRDPQPLTLVVGQTFELRDNEGKVL